MQPKMSFPDRKISESFLEFAGPLFEMDGKTPTREQIEKGLKLAFTVWNAVVIDTVHGNTQYITQVRRQIAEHPPLAEVIETMFLRKQSVFGHDLRLVGDYKLVQHDGEWRLRVEARAPSAI
jgi:hypothetical protein